MTSTSGTGTAAILQKTSEQNTSEPKAGEARGESVGGLNREMAGTALQQQILRNVVHELRQPLGSIEATAYYLDLVLPHGGQRAREHVARLHDFVGQCSWILACGLELANDRPLQPVLLDLETTITQVVAARAIPGEPAPELNLVGGLPLVLADPARVRTLMENLLSLFERLATSNHRVMIHTLAENGCVQMEMDVAVPGYRSENALGPGTSLGLESLRRGAQLHGADLVTVVDPIGGVYVRLSWPEASDAPFRS